VTLLNLCYSHALILHLCLTSKINDVLTFKVCSSRFLELHVVLLGTIGLDYLAELDWAVIMVKKWRILHTIAYVIRPG